MSYDVDTHAYDEPRYEAQRPRLGGLGDLCDICKENLVVEGYDECRDCLTELEAALDEIEERVEGTA